jgi:hypothetical protein
VIGSLLIGGIFISIDGSFCFATACSLAIKLGCVLGYVFDECELLFFRWEIIARSRLMYATSDWIKLLMAICFEHPS